MATRALFDVASGMVIVSRLCTAVSAAQNFGRVFFPFWIRFMSEFDRIQRTVSGINRIDIAARSFIHFLGTKFANSHR